MKADQQDQPRGVPPDRPPPDRPPPPQPADRRPSSDTPLEAQADPSAPPTGLLDHPRKRRERLAVARGAVRPHERALAPDLARGLMLLLIVMSNTGFYLWGSPHGPSGWHPVDGTALDRIVQF